MMSRPLRPWEVGIIRLALRSWPRRIRDEDAPAVLATLVERRQHRDLGGPGAACADTVLECLNLLRIGITLRMSGERRRGMGRVVSSARRDDSRLASMWSGLVMTLRALARSPGFSAGVVGILAVGIGSTVAIFSIVDGVALRRLPYAAPEELLRIGGVRHGRTGLGAVSGPNFRDLERAARQVNVTASASSAIAVGSGTSAPELLRGGYVSGAFFDVLGLPAAMGRTILPADDRPTAPVVVVISHELWRSRFGGRDVIGESIRVEGQPAAIVGVMPPDFYPPEGAHLGGAQVWVPLSHTTLPLSERGLSFLDLIGRSGPGRSIYQVNAELGAVGTALRERHELPSRAFGGFRAASLEEETLGNAGRTLVVLSATVVLLLAIAGANVANLLLLRTMDRTNELRIKISLGASRRRLIVENLAETVTLAVAGGAVGALGAHVAVGMVTRLAPIDIPRLSEVHVDLRVLAVAFILSITVGVVIGLGPILPVLTSRAPGAARGMRGVVGSRRATRARDSLVVAQVAMGLVLMIGAALLMRSLVRLHRVDPGVDTHQLYTISLRLEGMGGPASDVSLLDRLLDRSARLPHVRRASLTSGAPFTHGGWTVYIQPEGLDIDEEQLSRARVGLHQVSPGHLSHVGLQLATGRGFVASDTRGADPVVVISQSLATKYWPGQDVIGRRLVIGGDGTFTPRSIVGTVHTPRYGGPGSTLEEHVWLPYDQFPPDAIDIVLTVGDATALRESVHAMIQDLDDRIAIRSIQAADDALRQYMVEPAFFTALLGGFATVSLGLAMVGLYSSLAFLVRQRRRELGVRVALGADPQRLVRFVMIRGAGVTIIGVGLGSLGARGVARIFDTVLFGVAWHDPTAWIGACVALLLAALTASWVPARSAGRASPLDLFRAH